MSTAVLSAPAQSVFARLEELDGRIENLALVENPFVRERQGRQMIDVDLGILLRDAQQADPDERQALLALCYSREGEIYGHIVCGLAPFSTTEKDKQRDNEYMGMAAGAFARAARIQPDPYYFYRFGLVCVVLDRKQEAFEALTVAANGDVPDIAEKARVELARLRLDPEPFTPVNIALLASAALTLLLSFIQCFPLPGLGPFLGLALLASGVYRALIGARERPLVPTIGAAVVDKFGTRRVVNLRLMATAGVLIVLGLFCSTIIHLPLLVSLVAFGAAIWLMLVATMKGERRY